jgi:hypothetical protein
MTKRRNDLEQRAYEERMKLLRDSLQRPYRSAGNAAAIQIDNDGKLAEADLKILQAIIDQDGNPKL